MDNKRAIGVHYGGKKDSELNEGNLLKNAIIEFFNSLKNDIGIDKNRDKNNKKQLNFIPMEDNDNTPKKNILFRTKSETLFDKFKEYKNFNTKCNKNCKNENNIKFKNIYINEYSKKSIRNYYKEKNHNYKYIKNNNNTINFKNSINENRKNIINNCIYRKRDIKIEPKFDNKDYNKKKSNFKKYIKINDNRQDSFCTNGNSKTINNKESFNNYNKVKNIKSYNTLRNCQLSYRNFILNNRSSNNNEKICSNKNNKILQYNKLKKDSHLSFFLSGTNRKYDAKELFISENLNFTNNNNSSNSSKNIKNKDNNVDFDFNYKIKINDRDYFKSNIKEKKVSKNEKQISINKSQELDSNILHNKDQCKIF